MGKCDISVETLEKTRKIMYSINTCGERKITKIQRGDTMRKIRRTLIPFILLASVFATSVFAAPTQSELEEQKKQAEQEMKSLQAELTELMTEIDVTEQKLITTGEAIIDATERLEEAEENEQKQHDNMMKRIVTMYESGSSSMIQVILESGNIAEMLKNMENVQAVHEYDRKALEEYVAVKEEIAQLKVALEEEQASLVILEANLTQKQAALNDKIAAKKAEVNSIQADIDAAIAEAARLAAEKAEEEKKQQTIINSYTGTGDQSVGDAIVAAARTQLGVDYVWGGTTPYEGLDCSGLTQYCHKVVGISIPRVSYDQRRAGKEVWSPDPDKKTSESYGVSLARPGDVICYSGHVAIYIGNSRVIHAPQTGDVVKISTVYMKPILSIRRYW